MVDEQIFRLYLKYFSIYLLAGHSLYLLYRSSQTFQLVSVILISILLRIVIREAPLSPMTMLGFVASVSFAGFFLSNGVMALDDWLNKNNSVYTQELLPFLDIAMFGLLSSLFFIFYGHDRIISIVIKEGDFIAAVEIISILICFCVCIFLSRTRLNVHLSLLFHDKSFFRACGLNQRRVVQTAFVIGNALLGLAAIIFSSQRSNLRMDALMSDVYVVGLLTGVIVEQRLTAIWLMASFFAVINVFLPLWLNDVKAHLFFVTGNVLLVALLITRSRIRRKFPNWGL